VGFRGADVVVEDPLPEPSRPAMIMHATAPCEKPRARTPSDCRHDLLRHEDMPPWFQRLHGSSSIRIGYRPASRPLFFYAGTLFTLHNELVNAWSHIFGVMLFGVELATSDPRDLSMLSYRLAAAACFLVSATYHIFLPYSERHYARLQRADYATIFVLIGMSAVVRGPANERLCRCGRKRRTRVRCTPAQPYYAVEYNCHTGMEAAAVAVTLVAMTLLALLVGTQPWFGAPAAKLIRATAFCAFGGALVLFGGACAHRTGGHSVDNRRATDASIGPIVQVYPSWSASRPSHVCAASPRARAAATTARMLPRALPHSTSVFQTGRRPNLHSARALGRF
jgi:predicted membrane channel-forming protein YqfA (hemolysin III family)